MCIGDDKRKYWPIKEEGTAHPRDNLVKANAGGEDRRQGSCGSLMDGSRAIVEIMDLRGSVIKNNEEPRLLGHFKV